MPKRIRTTLRLTLAGSPALFATLLLAGCDHNSTDPQDPQLSTPAQFSRNVGLTDLQNSLNTGTARVEVSIIPGGLVARRVEIEEPREITKPEEVRGQITAITWSGGHGTATLQLGGLQIAFDSSTKLRPRFAPRDHGDTAGHRPHAQPTAQDFVARVQAELAAGHHAGVTARRSAPAQPQAPDDASFTASELEFDPGADHPSVKLNVSAASLATNSTPPPDAWLKLLGLQLELRVSDRTTELKIENPKLQGVRGFEGIVQAVDQTGGTVTLTDGTIIRIVAGTEFEPKGGPDDDRLTSLADVAAALAAGDTVGAEGKGLVEATSPLTLDAIKIEFEEQMPKAPKPPRPPTATVAFNGAVASVDLTTSSFTLADSTVVKVTAETAIHGARGLRTLQAVSDALKAGKRVRAEGRGTVAAVGPPQVLTANNAKFAAS